MRFATIDFETANESRASPCAVGVAIVDDGEVRFRRSWLIRPRVLDFNPLNAMIHGITEGDVLDAPEFDVVWNEIWPMLDGRIVLAHSAGFDIRIYLRSANRWYLRNQSNPQASLSMPR